MDKFTETYKRLIKNQQHKKIIKENAYDYKDIGTLTFTVGRRDKTNTPPKYTCFVGSSPEYQGHGNTVDEAFRDIFKQIIDGDLKIDAVNGEADTDTDLEFDMDTRWGWGSEYDSDDDDEDSDDEEDESNDEDEE